MMYNGWKILDDKWWIMDKEKYDMENETLISKLKRKLQNENCTKVNGK